MYFVRKISFLAQDFTYPAPPPPPPPLGVVQWFHTQGFIRPLKIGSRKVCGL